MEPDRLALVRRPTSQELLALPSDAPPATDVLQAVEQAVVMLAGAYGPLFQPAANLTLAWSVVLRDTSPAEIADALDEHLRDSSTRNGRSRNEYPPTAPELITRIQEARARRARYEKRVREYEDECVKWAENPERARRGLANCCNADGSRMTSAEVEAVISHGLKVIEARRAEVANPKSAVPARERNDSPFGIMNDVAICQVSPRMSNADGKGQ